MKEYFYGDREKLVDSRGQKIVEFYLNSSGKVKVVKKRGVESPQTTLKYGAQGPISVKLAELFNLEDSPFDSPKPIEMIKDFIARFVNSNDLVLDFFAGSSTTAHAVMQYNLENNSNVKFILIQFPENLDDRLKSATKDAKRTIESAIKYLDINNKVHFITEIGKERIKLAGEKIINNNIDSDYCIDIGFKVLKLNSSNIKEWNPDYDNLEQSFDDMLDNFVPNRTEEDVVYEIMLKYGIDLTYPVEEMIINGKKVFSVGFGALIICLDNNITLDVIEGIVEVKKELSPEVCRIVFRDNGFANDSVKTNAIQILRRNNIKEIMSI